MTSDKRENCHSLHGRVLSFIERRDGRAGLAEVARRAGDERPLEVLLDLTQWCSWDQSRRLLEAAADYLGCPEAVREAAAFYDREDLPEASADTVAALQALGGPGGILTTIAAAASKFSAVICMAPGEVGDLEGTVVARSVPGYPRYPMLCEATAGLLRVSGELFGLPPATVEEDCCECLGDAECRFRVAWAPALAEAARDSAAVNLAWLRARFASLRSTVADLVSGQDVEVVLERIVAGAARACRAPRYLLAVRLADGAPIRVHALGFAVAEAEAEAEVLLAEKDQVDLPWRLVLDVRSGARCYGRLLACNPDGVGFLPEDALNLTAYAELAAAALDGATALVEARRHADTAEALLDLARALGDVTSIEEVAARLAAAVPRVVGADSAAVHRWDGTKLSIMAAVGMPVGLAAELDSFSVPFGAPLRVAIEHGEPYVLDAASTRGQVRRICEASGTRAVALVPIRVGGELFGMVGAGVGVDAAVVGDDAQFVARLRGLASLAATAFENATLLYQIRHQSLHDSLTGMANLRLLADRVEQALAAGRRSGRPVAVAFVDLDGFKAINDTYGHGVGDDVLCRLAERMRRAVREADTVARVGGDEFVVLLPDVTDTAAATSVVEHLLAALREPFPIADTDIRVDASFGLALGPADGNDFETLLAAAAAAMYAHKRARPGR